MTTSIGITKNSLVFTEHSVVIAINTEFFLGLETFKKIAGLIVRGLRNPEKAPGEERIYTAREKEWNAWKYRKVHGCPVPEVLQKQMVELQGQM